MGRKYTEHCDLCQVELKGNRRGKHGFCAEVGYSLGGWGYRKNFVPKLSVEVCRECWSELKEKSEELSYTIDKLRSTRRDKDEWEPEETEEARSLWRWFFG